MKKPDGPAAVRLFVFQKRILVCKKAFARPSPAATERALGVVQEGGFATPLRWPLGTFVHTKVPPPAGDDYAAKLSSNDSVASSATITLSVTCGDSSPKGRAKPENLTPQGANPADECRRHAAGSRRSAATEAVESEGAPAKSKILFCLRSKPRQRVSASCRRKPQKCGDRGG